MSPFTNVLSQEELIFRVPVAVPCQEQWPILVLELQELGLQMIYRIDQLMFGKAELRQEWLEGIAPAVIEGLESFSYQRKLMGLWLIQPSKVKAARRNVAELQGTRRLTKVIR